MRKRLWILFPALVLIAAWLIPVRLSQKFRIGEPIFTVYPLLTKGANWEKWRPELRQLTRSPRAGLALEQDSTSFSVTGGGNALKVSFRGNVFKVDDAVGDHQGHYTIALIPDTNPARTVLIATQSTSALGFLAARLSGSEPAYSSVADLDHYLKTDSLRYGVVIRKMKVPEKDLVEIKRKVVAAEQFHAAAKMLRELQACMCSQGLQPCQPVMAQFLPRGRDSAEVNVGFFIDRPATAVRDILPVSMPKGGPLYTAVFSGRFDQRSPVYAALRQYFSDHHYQAVVLPFDMYLDNRLPVSDSDHIRIRVNVSAYF